MICCSEPFFDMNSSGPNISLTISLPDLFGVIEALSYGDDVVIAFWACDAAGFRGAWSTPATIGVATITMDAAASNSFRLKLSLRVTRSLMIRIMLRLRSAPVTPETQGNGEPRQNSQ